jgi:hypothetical protein
MPIPHGSDWPSIREAGMNADKREASSDDAASTDEYGYEQKGHETVVRLNQRNEAYALEPKRHRFKGQQFSAWLTFTPPKPGRVDHPKFIAKRESGTK